MDHQQRLSSRSSAGNSKALMRTSLYHRLDTTPEGGADRLQHTRRGALGLREQTELRLRTPPGRSGLNALTEEGLRAPGSPDPI
eukprot:3308944-Pleurochrysis_carterae.AAC.3